MEPHHREGQRQQNRIQRFCYPDRHIVFELTHLLSLTFSITHTQLDRFRHFLNTNQRRWRFRTAAQQVAGAAAQSQAAGVKKNICGLACAASGEQLVVLVRHRKRHAQCHSRQPGRHLLLPLECSAKPQPYAEVEEQMGAPAKEIVHRSHHFRSGLLTEQSKQPGHDPRLNPWDWVPGWPEKNTAAKAAAAANPRHPARAPYIFFIIPPAHPSTGS